MFLIKEKVKMFPYKVIFDEKALRIELIEFTNTYRTSARVTSAIKLTNTKFDVIFIHDGKKYEMLGWSKITKKYSSLSILVSN